MTTIFVIALNDETLPKETGSTMPEIAELLRLVASALTNKTEGRFFGSDGFPIMFDEKQIGVCRFLAAGDRFEIEPPQCYLDPAIAEMVVGRGPQPGSVRSIDRLTEPSAREKRSARETEVLQLAAAGYTNNEVSSQLRIGVKTIEAYKARAMKKLGLGTRAELVRYAIVKGWLGGPLTEPFGRRS